MSDAILQCPICSSGIQVGVEFAGQQIQCPSCQQAVQLPPDLSPFVQPTMDEASAAQADPLTSLCSVCNQRFGITADMIGQQVACPFCQQLTVVQAAPASMVESTVAEIVAEQSEAPEEDNQDDDVDESELFAPSFAPKIDIGTPSDTPTSAASSSSSPELPPKIQTAVEIPDPEPAAEATVDEYGLAHADEMEPIFELKMIPHPALPPTFESIPGDSEVPTTVVPWNTSTDILLPTATGGVQPIDRHTVGIRTNAGRVVIRATPKEKKEFRRRLRSMIVYAFCALLLVAVLVALVWINNQ